MEVIGMEERAQTPNELEVVRTRFYYIPETGEVVHVNTMAAPAGVKVDKKWIDEATETLEEALAKRHGKGFKSIDVDDEEVLKRAEDPNAEYSIDPKTGGLVFRQAVEERP
jgi:hypothetical protein